MWDWAVCDEGHKLKNPAMQLVRKLRGVPCLRTLILSGTPIQNNLSELWALFDVVTPGLLGACRSEHSMIVTKEVACFSGRGLWVWLRKLVWWWLRSRSFIHLVLYFFSSGRRGARLQAAVRAEDRRRAVQGRVGEGEGGANARLNLPPPPPPSPVPPRLLRLRTGGMAEAAFSPNPHTQEGEAAARALRLKIAPVMLRREKATQLGGGGGAASSGQPCSTDAGVTAVAADTAVARGGGGGAGSRPAALPQKRDFIVWLRPTAEQRRLYTAFLARK